MEVYLKHQSHIELLAQKAAECHAAVNQTYGGYLPYSFHLNLVAGYTGRYMHLIDVADNEVETLFAAAYFHDAIEDARLSYNDLIRMFEKINHEHGLEIQTTEAAEIVYALTNDKGRTRAERASEAYYAGIRNTRFASFLKMCDRLANLRYSTLTFPRQRMAEVYQQEMPHFLKCIGNIPAEMIEEAYKLLNEA